jgi:hypothetical protein
MTYDIFHSKNVSADEVSSRITFIQNNLCPELPRVAPRSFRWAGQTSFSDDHFVPMDACPAHYVSAN